MIHKTLAQTLAEHVIENHDVKPELRDWMRLLLFDFLGVSFGGAGLDSTGAARAAVTLSDRQSPQHSAALLGSDSWASPEDAALVNGIMAHGLELDDTFEEASLHPAVVIFPALLAVADERELPAEDLIAAAIVGYDVMCSAGVLLGARESYGRGFHPTGVAGVLGSAAAVARMLGRGRGADARLGSGGDEARAGPGG